MSEGFKSPPLRIKQNGLWVDNPSWGRITPARKWKTKKQYCIVCGSMHLWRQSPKFGYWRLADSCPPIKS